MDLERNPSYKNKNIKQAYKVNYIRQYKYQKI